MGNVSITSSDMEKASIDSTPEELINFKKMQKSDLETTCYQQLMMLREVKLHNTELERLIKENNVQDIKGLKHIKEDYDELKEINARNEKKIDSLTMTIKNKTWEHERSLDKLINPVPKLVNQSLPEQAERA